MLRSTFASFTAAQLAVRANQNSLAIVGQNIANVNTNGYTRQRIDQVSLNLTTNSALYQTIPEAHIGYGVQVTGVSQIRDPFLDVRYRLEMGNIGTEDKKLDILEKVTGILDEFNRDKAVDDQFSDFFQQLSTMASNSDSNDTLARSSAKTLTDMIRKYADQLSEIKDNLEITTGGDVDDVNSILDNIQKLNVSIKNSQVHGDSALELQDQRNQLIDQLATYANINVTHSTDFTMTGSAVDVMKIDMISEDGEKIRLIDDTSPAAQFTFQTPIGNAAGKYAMTVRDAFGHEYDAASNKGVFKSALEMLNGNGEYDSPATERGVGYFQKSLDNMARVFAKTMNDLNTVTKEADGTDADPVRGGSLFAPNDGTTEITAANISLSQEWLDGAVHILPSRDQNPTTSDLSNVDNMKNALTNWKIEFKTSDGPNGNTIYKGTFQEFFTNIASTASSDYKATSAALDNYINISNTIADSKDSVSGVNVDEEYMNMMQYNNALNAASRLMTALDEALNTIISSMGIVGR